MRRLRLRSRLLRATSAGVCLALASVPAGAQLRPGAAERAKELNQQAAQPNNADAAAAANPAAQVAPVAEAPRVIQHIVVRGTQRVEPDSVVSYMSLRQGAPYDSVGADSSLKILFETGLFADVRMDWDPATGTTEVGGAVFEHSMGGQLLLLLGPRPGVGGGVD